MKISITFQRKKNSNHNVIKFDVKEDLLEWPSAFLSLAPTIDLASRIRELGLNEFADDSLALALFDLSKEEQRKVCAWSFNPER